MNSNSITFHAFRSSRVALAALVVLLLCGKLALGQKIVELHNSATDVVADNHGKVLVLLFVRTDCPISNRYAPLIQQMSKQYGAAASFQLVFSDRNQSEGKIKEYLNDYHYQLPVIRDIDHILTRRTLVKVTPEAVVFDSKGALVYHGRIDNLYEHIGSSRRAASTHELADAIDATIKGVKVQVPATDGVGCFIADLE